MPKSGLLLGVRLPELAGFVFPEAGFGDEFGADGLEGGWVTGAPAEAEWLTLGGRLTIVAGR